MNLNYKSIYMHAGMKCFPKDNGVSLSNSYLLVFVFDNEGIMWWSMKFDKWPSYHSHFVGLGQTLMLWLGWCGGWCFMVFLEYLVYLESLHNFGYSD